jgi:hypothetical protein
MILDGIISDSHYNPTSWISENNKKFHCKFEDVDERGSAYSFNFIVWMNGYKTESIFVAFCFVVD